MKGATYDPFKILGEGLPPEEVGALFQKVGPGLKGISAAPLDLVVNMGGVWDADSVFRTSMLSPA